MARDQFMIAFKRFLSRHLDQHHSAETTLELEVAALITMVDVGSTSVHIELWRETLSTLLEYADQSLRGDTTARMRALYRLADAHTDRIAKL